MPNWIDLLLARRKLLLNNGNNIDMVKIIESIGAGDNLCDFDNYHWKDEPENGLNCIKPRYPISTSEERWKEITMSGE